MLFFIMFSENLRTGNCSEGRVEEEKFQFLFDTPFPQLKFKKRISLLELKTNNLQYGNRQYFRKTRRTNTNVFSEHSTYITPANAPNMII